MYSASSLKDLHSFAWCFDCPRVSCFKHIDFGISESPGSKSRTVCRKESSSHACAAYNLLQSLTIWFNLIMSTVLTPDVPMPFLALAVQGWAARGQEFHRSQEPGVRLSESRQDPWISHRCLLNAQVGMILHNDGQFTSIYCIMYITFNVIYIIYTWYIWFISIYSIYCDEMDWIEVQLTAAECKACKAMGATKQRDQLLQRNAALPPLSSWLGELRQACLWLHMISSFFIVFPCCPMSKQSFSSVQTQMGKSHDLCWSLKHCTQTNLARRKAAQAQAADARRDSASARQCETMNVTPWHLTSLDIHCANLTSKEISEEAKISAFEKARMAGTHILVTGCENMCQSYHNISQLHSFKMSKEFEKKRLIRYDKIWQDMTRWHEHVNIHVKHHVNIHVKHHVNIHEESV